MTAPSPSLLSDSISTCAVDLLIGRAVMGVSDFFFFSSNEFGGDGGVLAG